MWIKDEKLIFTGIKGINGMCERVNKRTESLSNTDLKQIIKRKDKLAAMKIYEDPIGQKA